MFGTYRTLLALLVVAQHLGGASLIGVYAVFGFYILSGYLMTLIMHRSYGYGALGMVRYALNRVLRIYPVYWASALISVLLILLFGESFSTSLFRSLSMPASAEDWLRNVFLLFPNLEEPRLSPATWALTVELFFYACIGLGVSRSKPGTLLWFAASAAYHVAINWQDLPWGFQYYLITAASLPFATGALIFHYRNDLLQFVPSILRSPWLPAGLFGLLLLNWFVGIHEQRLLDEFFYLNFVLCALMVVVLSGTVRLPGISRKLDNLIGDFSYPIYLLHFQAGLVAWWWLRLDDVAAPARSLGVFALGLPILLLMSWGLVRLVERPVEILRARIKVG